jgi:DNA-binding FadR family transcriptional regulator
MAALRRRRPAAVTDRVYDAILEQIVNGTLVPGQQLPSEDRLAAQYGVTRTTLRRALARLREHRLVAAVKGAGNFAVRAPLGANTDWMGSAETADISARLEVRRGLEVEAAGLAAERRSDEQLARLRQTIADMDTLIGPPRQDRAIRFRMGDIAFHETLHQATGNPALAALCGPFLLHPDNWRVRWSHGQGPVRVLGQAVVSEHRSIMLALEARSAEAARAAMRLHIDQTRERYLSAGSEAA